MTGNQGFNTKSRLELQGFGSQKIRSLTLNLNLIERIKAEPITQETKVMHRSIRLKIGRNIN